MKILFDARWILVENRFDGVSRYSHELAHALAARDDLDVAWLVYDQRQVNKLPAGEIVWANNPNDILKETFTLAHTINKSGYDLVYSPFFTIGTFGKRFKLILTIHDMIYFTHRTPPQWLPWHVRAGWWLFHLTYWPMRWQLNKADIVATVSDTARKELLDARATKREIITVPNAVGDAFSRRSQSNNNESPLHSKQSATRSLQSARSEAVSREEESNGDSGLENVVYMGAFTPYKNVECVIDAVAQVPDVTLHLCGKLPPARRSEIEARIRGHNLESRTVIYDGATDDQYRTALLYARCAISASRLEGFGLPVLEAQNMGVPFVAASTPIFHEVGADSVVYFDPNNPDEAAACIRNFADSTLRSDYVARGYQNAARYTWSNSAEQAAKICAQTQIK